MGIRIVHGHWHYRFKHGGQEYTGNTGADATSSDPVKVQRNRERALQAEARARAAIEQGRTDALKIHPRKFSEAAQDFLRWAEVEHRDHPATTRRLRTSFSSLLEQLATRNVAAISAGAIEDYKAWRRTCPGCRGARPAVEACDVCEASGLGVREITLRHDLHALSAFFQYAAKQRWCVSNPVRQVEIPSDRDAVRFNRIPPDQEAAYFRAALQQGLLDLHDAARLIRLQGARPGEVLVARVEDVDVQASTWAIPRSKSDAGRRVLRLLPEARSILARRAAENEAHLFAGLTPSKLAKAHREVITAIPGAWWVLYDFRHQFATDCAARGMPLPQLAYILGHRDLKTIMRYVHVSQEQAAKAMETWGPQPSIWGPLPDENFLFACGDDRNTGILYATKGNDPDSEPDTHQIEITTIPEAIQ